jgi:hypothetical protein
VSDLASHSTDYSVVEQESPDVLSRNLRVGGQLWSSSTLFFFAAFLFAYFYLRALNTHGQFKPKAVDAPTGWGTRSCSASSQARRWSSGARSTSAPTGGRCGAPRASLRSCSASSP